MKKDIERRTKYVVFGILLVAFIGGSTIAKNLISPNFQEKRVAEKDTKSQDRLEETDEESNQKLTNIDSDSTKPDPLKHDSKSANNLKEEDAPVFLSPLLDAYLVCDFGCFEGHSGADFAYLDRDSKDIYAIGSGVVIEVDYDAAKGNYIVIRHDQGYTSHYAHLQEVDVSVGTDVTSNTLIGQLGMTGRATTPHIHLEIRNILGDLLDPESFLVNRS